jgi:hypothetical protein
MTKINFLKTMAILFLSTQVSAKDANPHSLEDSHTTIYTENIIRIVNALDVGSFQTEKDYFKMLITACERNNCSTLEKQNIQLVGEQIINCQIKHLKSHKIANTDAKNICESKQALLGCDTLVTPLLRKMCYTGNQYDLNALIEKEKRMKNRLPASQ